MAFLEEQRDDGLRGLPRTAVIRGAELPRVEARPPRGIDKQLFERLVDPERLMLLSSEQHRTLILLLAYTGMRISSLVLLRRDALETGSDGHPYLRFHNVKLCREAVIPIGPALAEQLARQEEHLRQRFPEGTDWLFPSPPARGASGFGRGGRFHLAPDSVGEIVRNYVRKADNRDASGELATWVHPHLFRHHLGTSMVNDGVPLPVIQKLFDHASIVMTARYAQLHDETLRREVTRWHERVNVRGERVALPLDRPLEEAAWMKERIARARQALPTATAGCRWCRPARTPAPVSAAATSSPTRPSAGFTSANSPRPRSCAKAEQRGSLRLVDVLERDERSLTRILQGLEDLEAEPDDDDEPLSLDVVALAEADRAGGGAA